MDELKQLLEQPLAAQTWKTLLVDIERSQVKLSEALRDKQMELARMKNAVKPMKDGKLYATELDRTLYIDSQTAELQAEVDKLLDLKEIVERRFAIAELLSRG